MTVVTIHPLAIVEEGAEIGNNVHIGPFCHVGPQVKLGDNVDLKSHVVVAGHTTIEEHTVVFPFASLGHVPQDKKFQGEHSSLEIGKRNIIREYVTINPGTEGGGSLTKVGNDGLFMIGVHIAHDCHIGNHVIFANHATLAGHVHVGDHAIIGGLSAIHQFVRIGEHAMIGGMSGAEQDVIPYGVIVGERAHLSGLNLIGLKRRNFSPGAINQLRDAYKILFDKNIKDFENSTLLERIEKVISQYKDSEEVMHVVNFIKNDSKRNICMPKYG
ncbi:acyl-ACP--UDP-N-acetylglucosamine O-acyltransferase [Candidatus Paracaedibacter symbiosus]|uniref:acyl-ACP--UDP-N-acetylglucosamine O-acyltransferase n=1 Tax=Candidatus Paracaedibacter symbiosus TaxID=244582 RepID=UPI000509F53C|nr:acyl-ACP--UDP-N-acetylglucosamine O-acyltransferase [Candidatus Paracaedibacter symbiosus]